MVKSIVKNKIIKEKKQFFPKGKNMASTDKYYQLPTLLEISAGTWIR